MSKEYGIVLEGEDAKGTYQVGAWRALREAGTQTEGAAGTPINALNGALICTDGFEKAECIWENISCSRVMDADDELAKRLRKFSLKDVFNLASSNVGGLITGTIRVLRDGGSDIAPLRALIEDVVDEEKIRNSDRELYAIAYSVSDRHPLIADVKGTPGDAVADLLMASAYLTGFRQERLGGKYYTDGDGVNNVPVDMLLDRGYKNMVVMRIYDCGVDTEKKLEVLRGVNLYHVAPRRDLGGPLESNRHWARRNTLLGCFDGRRMLCDLAGRVYYIDAPEGGPYYFDKMMSETQSFLSYTKPELETAGETKTGREVQKETIMEYRVYAEQILLRLTEELELKEGQDYKELYLSILGDLAKQYRTSRSKIYTVKEFLRLIHKKTGTAALRVMIPVSGSGTQMQYTMHKGT